MPTPNEKNPIERKNSRTVLSEWPTPNANAPLPRGEWWMIRMNDDGRLFALTGERQTAETWAPGRSTPVRFVELRDGESITAPASPDDERARLAEDAILQAHRDGYVRGASQYDLRGNSIATFRASAAAEFPPIQAARQQPNGEGRTNG